MIKMKIKMNINSIRTLISNFGAFLMFFAIVFFCLKNVFSFLFFNTHNNSYHLLLLITLSIIIVFGVVKFGDIDNTDTPSV